MSKKNALGEINLDFEESINTINGIPITPNEVIKEQKVTQKKEEDMLDNILDADTKKAIYENRRKIYNDTPKEEDLEALKKKVLKEMHTDNKTPFEMKGTTDEQQKKDNKPSTKKHLKEGYTRHTFAIKDEQLELIRAIAEYKGIEQKQLLETLLNKAFESIDEATKEKALNYLHNEDEKDLDIFR